MKTIFVGDVLKFRLNEFHYEVKLVIHIEDGLVYFADGTKKLVSHISNMDVDVTCNLTT
jgi:hypothetical protein